MSVTALVSDAERAIQGGDLKRAAKLLEEGVLAALDEIDGLDPAERKRQRRAKYRVMGVLASV